MCAINGIFAYHYAANPVARDEVLRTRDYMAARGPDGSGLWISSDERVGLGHRRLAIIDLSPGGVQPMQSADANLIISFNGEIYNYKELRAGLEARGHTFRTHSDTEVLLHLYAEKGDALVHDLRGMFAFALWDGKKRSLLLARDPNGIKPLYYADDGWTIRFASQVKALLAGGKCAGTPDAAGLAGYYMFGFVPEPFTMFSSIRALPAGSTLRVDGIGIHGPHRYFSLADVYRQAEDLPLSARPGRREVVEALADSVRAHLVSDVPVGAFLSAGIDSGSLVGLMRDTGLTGIPTITVAFDEFAGTPADESILSRKVSELYGTRHTTRTVTKEELLADFKQILISMDQPSIDGFNAWFVSKAMREYGVKVAISGLGGDELFGGYPSFSQVPRLVRALRLPAVLPGLPKLARRFASHFQLTERLGLHPKSAGLLEYAGGYPAAYFLKRALFMPWELGKILGRDVAEEGLRRLDPVAYIASATSPAPRTPFGRVAVMESAVYMRNQLLRDSDWASMAHGLELRTPLVDHVLQRSVAAYTTSGQSQTGKALLAHAPSTPLPQEIVTRAKTGFGFPTAHWMSKLISIPDPTDPLRPSSASTRALAIALAGTCGLHVPEALLDTSAA
ncbi:MAG: asparagine synthase (glutamine-hydrolyzing) [Hyphomicrobium sp.]|nr:asparagine synthase (glutamine-hydrolyzing) [Hyphomicrobium sp.]